MSTHRWMTDPLNITPAVPVTNGLDSQETTILKPVTTMDVFAQILSPFPTRVLLPLTTVSQRFHALILRILHNRLLVSASLKEYKLILECFHPTSKLTEPHVFCKYLGTDGLSNKYEGKGSLYENVTTAQQLGRLSSLYSRFRPEVTVEESASGHRLTPSTDNEPLSPDQLVVTRPINLEEDENFSQLCVVVNIVKVMPGSNLLLSTITVEDGVIRVFRDWLKEHKEHGRLNKEVPILWVGQNKNVGLKVRVREKSYLNRPAPVLLHRDEDPFTCYELYIDEAPLAPKPSKLVVNRTKAKGGFRDSIRDQYIVTHEIINYLYEGSGTEDDPFSVTWIPNDPRNPMNFSAVRKWCYTILVSFVTLTVALVSSAYSGGMGQIVKDFDCKEEVAILGISLFVLGFAFGPLLWAPLSETFGRRHIFTSTFSLLTAFNAGAAGSKNIQTLIILRFLAGFFGSSPFGNAGGTIADMFPASHRGIAISLFAAAPLCGPTIGPVIGGFLGSGAGWRWVEGFLAALAGVIWLCMCVLLPETYAPVLLRRRAEKLSELSGHVYRSKLDIERGQVTMSKTLSTALSRPWLLMFKEPIVLLFCIYMAIIYGTLYMLFAAYPIVFQQTRGWSEGVGGLAFLGILVGMVIAVACTFPDNMHYAKLCSQTTGRLAPEVRLPPSIVGGIALPIGLFWFAWTNSPSVHWMASVAAGMPFGFGLVLVFLSVFNYLIDAYTIFSASVLAANSALRSLFGFAFPLFTTYMYQNLGIHWASSIPAFLAVACIPFPIIIYLYGARIRKRCVYAAEAEAFMERLAAMRQSGSPGGAPAPGNPPPVEKSESIMTRDDSEDSEGLSTVPSETMLDRRASRASRRSGHTLRQTATQYEENPYDIDRINTRNSVISHQR
ncbi:hypothetical protein FE257_009962 [Aspergillus nanangensis]|uniref:Major facilitator superfamily (MFS) profile domain-containing protein n=1 Tax=Aspergillus nanangensis TaxID=2582783 RepID=A0AAD4CY22_ASPNN|nr:hypothetical protein FE257_009962 [Aspergillus nanangensis]